MTPRPGEPPAHPLRHDDDLPPPRREQLPLPRRSQQDHLEPQLRVPGGSGEGTPFTAFDPDGEEPAATRSTRADRAAAFHDGTERGRARATHPHRRSSASPNPHADPA